jgi:hypothetical protein
VPGRSIETWKEAEDKRGIVDTTEEHDDLIINMATSV